jgi:uncharacterized protein YecE (DUF72 family)
MAALRVGTSGYAYPAWKGSFYPARLPAAEMLAHYGRQLPTVEINHTFYRMPAEKTLAGWAAAVTPGFRFALKLNQKLTHVQRLRDAEELLERFLSAVGPLARTDHLGPILVQLPPQFRADLARLERFLGLVPPLFRLALEVRHPSWLTDETYAILRQHRVALCLAETDEGPAPDAVTADFVYLRLRREAYAPAAIAAWRGRCLDWVAAGLDVYAYFKHEDAGVGPAYARALLTGPSAEPPGVE